MTPLSRHRELVKVSDSLIRRLDLYAIAAGASGVGVLLSPQSGEASIVYTKAHHRIIANTSYSLDLNHDGVPDFVLSDRHRTTNTLFWGYLSAVPMRSNGVEGVSTRSGFGAYALQPGAVIGPKRPFGVQKMEEVRIEDSGFYYYGKWVKATNRYLGLKFEVAGKLHYGWARLSTVFDGGARIAATLTGYAYETVPNKPIIAGKTMGSDAPGRGLGHLARGPAAPSR